MAWTVHLSKQARSDLLRVPQVIRKKLKIWTDIVEREGLEQARRSRGSMTSRLKVRGRDKGPFGSTVRTAPYTSSCLTVRLTSYESRR